MTRTVVNHPNFDLGQYSLVICEKPDAAGRIAQALADEPVERSFVEGLPVLKVKFNRRLLVIASALGHLYTVDDPTHDRRIYPVFDVEWVQKNLVEKKPRDLGKRIELFKKLAANASQFINACDFDLEGETIGSNILRYACGEEAEEKSLRVKFSTLTREEIRQAFLNAREVSIKMAEAGRARHIIDFLYGVNLSRAITDSLRTDGVSQTLTTGRVQGPTLSFVIVRELEIGTFVPLPYWTLEALLDADGSPFKAHYERSRLAKLAEAWSIKESCLGKQAIVSMLNKAVIRRPPPVPFNTGDLQKEAYRVFGFSPSLTLSIAERLYLDALISYPRTNSQRLPPTIDYRRILTGIGRIQSYSRHVKELLPGRLVPHQGEKEDPAHPSIHPTGEIPGSLGPREGRLYDLIVRRFLSVFGDDALEEKTSATMAIGEHLFKASGIRILKKGWMQYYAPYARFDDRPLPNLRERQILKVLSVDLERNLEQPPPKYSQSSLLEKMEIEGIGTKTTRSEIIKTLLDRNYVTGQDRLTPTELGFAVMESMKRYCSEITSTEMTTNTERSLEDIELGTRNAEDVVERVIEGLVYPLKSISDARSEIGKNLNIAFRETLFSKTVLGPCPLCGNGKLRVIKSRKTGKRFVGCSNYSSGCRASAPLPQKGTLTFMSKPCSHCNWPIVSIWLRRRPWRFCVNTKCPGRIRNELQTVRTKY